MGTITKPIRLIRCLTLAVSIVLWNYSSQAGVQIYLHNNGTRTMYDGSATFTTVSILSGQPASFVMSFADLAPYYFYSGYDKSTSYSYNFWDVDVNINNLIMVYIIYTV